ncbi:MAG: DUF3261 domain-containing protein [Treponema sp.]|nr:DUF3261 domain-containing protein [Treponema sp.]
MRAMKLLFFFPVCVVCVLSCASGAGKGALSVNITDNSKFVLLPPQGIEQAMDMAQYLSTEFMGHSIFLTSWVKADENAIEMTLFNELGASMGELSYKDGAVHFSSTVIPKSFMRAFKPEYIIADFQLCFYDPVMLSNSLKDSGLVFETKDGGRRILNGNEVIIEIKKTENTVELVNYLKKYSYTLEGDFH